MADRRPTERALGVFFDPRQLTFSSPELRERGDRDDERVRSYETPRGRVWIPRGEAEPEGGGPYAEP